MTPRRPPGTGTGNTPRPPAGGAVMTIDIAHPPMSSDDAERALDEALRSALLAGTARLIRIIHGYGSGGKGGTLKITARNWAYRRRGKFLVIVPGEEYSPFDPRVTGLLGAAGISLGEVGPSDPGVTILLLP